MSLYWLAKGLTQSATNLRPHERWSRAQLKHYQERAFRQMARYAYQHSPFYRSLYQGLDVERAPIADFPIVSKKLLMDNFEEAVTDRRLRLTEIQAHTDVAGGEELYRGRFMVLRSSGSGGVPGVFPHTRAAVALNVAASFRQLRLNHVKLTVPWRSVTVAGIHADHLSYRLASLLNGPPLPISSRAFASNAPMQELAVHLDRAQPSMVIAFPSVLDRLLDEQEAGRMRIYPRAVIMAGENCPGQIVARLHQLWPRARIIDTYAFSEVGVAGTSCSQCGVMHLFEDMAMFEVTDGRGQRVEPGQRGEHLLVTNLINTALPLIRYEMSDLLTIEPRENPCGSPFASVKAVEGRADDVLILPKADGSRVVLTPNTIANIFSEAKLIVGFQVVYRPESIRLRVIPRGGHGGPEVEQQVATHFLSVPERLGAVPPRIDVQMVETLTTTNGKLKRVISEIKLSTPVEPTD